MARIKSIETEMDKDAIFPVAEAPSRPPKENPIPFQVHPLIAAYRRSFTTEFRNRVVAGVKAGKSTSQSFADELREDGVTIYKEDLEEAGLN